MSTAAPKQEERFVTRDGRSNIVQLGLRTRPLQDAYFLLLTSSWPRLMVLGSLTYLAVNALFGVLYFLVGGIENARPGSFWDTFFFSVQTLSTIGYGGMVPRSTGANFLVMMEAFLGLLGFAMVTGLMFSKFARPTARVLWSNVGVVNPQNGVPCFQFRCANERQGNLIVEAQMRVWLVRNETTKEGASLRRIIDLPLQRERMGLFSLSWLVFHPITEASPLHGATTESLAAQQVEIICSFIGTDEVSAQFVHARHSYRANEIIWGARFADIISQLPDGRRAVDYRLFHDVKVLGSQQ